MMLLGRSTNCKAFVKAHFRMLKFALQFITQTQQYYTSRVLITSRHNADDRLPLAIVFYREARTAHVNAERFGSNFNVLLQYDGNAINYERIRSERKGDDFESN
jgi:hypothetical protein